VDVNKIDLNFDWRTVMINYCPQYLAGVYTTKIVISQIVSTKFGKNSETNYTWLKGNSQRIFMSSKYIPFNNVLDDLRTRERNMAIKDSRKKQKKA
jgi:hypothetical protein